MFKALIKYINYEIYPVHFVRFFGLRLTTESGTEVSLSLVMYGCGLSARKILRGRPDLFFGNTGERHAAAQGRSIHFFGEPSKEYSGKKKMKMQIWSISLFM